MLRGNGEKDKQRRAGGKGFYNLIDNSGFLPSTLPPSAARDCSGSAPRGSESPTHVSQSWEIHHDFTRSPFVCCRNLRKYTISFPVEGRRTALGYFCIDQPCEHPTRSRLVSKHDVCLSLLTLNTSSNKLLLPPSLSNPCLFRWTFMSPVGYRKAFPWTPVHIQEIQHWKCHRARPSPFSLSPDRQQRQAPPNVAALIPFHIPPRTRPACTNCSFQRDF